MRLSSRSSTCRSGAALAGRSRGASGFAGCGWPFEPGGAAAVPARAAAAAGVPAGPSPSRRLARPAAGLPWPVLWGAGAVAAGAFVATEAVPSSSSSRRREHGPGMPLVTPASRCFFQ